MLPPSGRTGYKFKGDHGDSLKTNNNSIIAGLKTICEILAEHNKSFSKSGGDNASGGTAHSCLDTEIHTPLVDCVGMILKSFDKLSLTEVRQELRNSLEVSVCSFQSELGF